MTDLSELERVARAATQSEWRKGLYQHEHGHIVLSKKTEHSLAWVCAAFTDTDAAYIATFDPPTVLALIARAERAEAEAAKLRAVVDAARDALGFYAAEWRYDYDETCCFCGVPPGKRKGRAEPDSQNGVMGDNGEIARAALAALEGKP